MSEQPIMITWQYCQAGNEIIGSLYAADDADMVRAWDDDFCLIEVTRTADGTWEPTGGDGRWVDLAEKRFASPEEALAAYLGNEPYLNAS
jgi:hypothetical protein